MIAETAKIKDFKAAKSPRLVSFENSNSWLKRHDDAGTLVIQAGYQLNPRSIAQRNRDEENPIVVVNGQPPRWYGVKACQGQYTPIHGQSKIETARESFTACLRPSDHERDLVVIASHWDDCNLEPLKAALKGRYQATVNGHLIQCKVISVVTIEEGLGSYYMVRDRLKPGASLLIEMGFGTAEFWLIDESGNPQDGGTVDNLGIAQLCSDLALDPQIRAIASDNANPIAPALISRCLRDGHPSRVNPDTWEKLKANYASEHLKRLQAYIKSQWANRLQDVPNIILTGGGASLLTAIQPKLHQVFIIPDRPQTASVRGSYEWQLAKV